MENATFLPVTRRSSNVFQLELPKTEETRVHGLFLSIFSTKKLIFFNLFFSVVNSFKDL